MVLYGCEGLLYCGRKLEVSVDGSTWSTVIERSTYYDAWNSLGGLLSRFEALVFASFDLGHR